MTTLHGQRLLVTRAEDDSKLWASRLEKLGAEAIIFPCIECVLQEDQETAHELDAALSSAHWLVLCSRRAVQAVAGLLNRAGSRLPDSVQIAVVGPATAKSANELLGRADLVARGGTSAALCAELVPLLCDRERVVAALTEISDRSIETQLSATGATVRRIDVYRSGPVPAQEIRTPLSTAEVDLALLASPSAVAGLLNRAVVQASLPVLTIGPSTTASAHSAGLNVVAEARERSLDSMLEALETAL